MSSSNSQTNGSIPSTEGRGGGHEFRITRTRLSDGRELLYFDDEPDYVAGKKTRKLNDERDLPEAITESELRQDPLTGDWYCYAAHRMNRTFMPPANENPLAPTVAGQLPTEVPASDYDVVVFENRFPSLSMHMEVPDDFATTVDGQGIFPRRPALARCEVVCFTPTVTDSFRNLTFSRARTVIEAWAHRTAELSAIEGVRLVFPFENRGKEIGVTLQHPHGQIYSYPYLPPRAASITARAKAYREATGRDLFDDVLAAEKESGKRIIAAGAHFTAFVPAAAKWPVEVMLMANRAVGDFSELTDAEKDELAVMYLDLLRRIDRFFPGIDKTPYIAAWNQAPVGEDHEFGRFHLQLYSMMRSAGRMKFLAGSESGQGAWISDTTPEAIANRIREVGEPLWLTSRSREQATEEVADLYRRSFGTDPQGIFSAPGRVNLIGEHVDYAGGICLPFALSQSTFAAIGARDDADVRVISDLMEDSAPLTIPLDSVEPGSPANWSGYAVGTIWAMREAGLLPTDCPGFDIALTSDVPVGAGLSSSAALECSVGVAAFELVHGRSANEQELAGIINAAIRAENEVVGASTGGLDQRISVKGAEGHALAIDFSDNSDYLVEAALSADNLEILVINTNVRHTLADGQYASRRGVIDAVTEGLGVESLRELDDAVGAATAWAKENVPAEYLTGASADEDCTRQWLDIVARRVRHVVTETDRTAEAIAKLSERDFEALGELMVASHRSLRDDYEVSCPELDVAVEVSLEQGALGARMTGGGFGGSAIALMPKDRVEAVARAVSAAMRLRGMPEPEFLVATPSAGAARVR